MLLFSEFVGLDIKAVSVALPTRQQPITFFSEKFGEKSVDQISEMTGVKSFHRAIPKQTASDLGFEAAVNLIKKENVDATGIDFLVFVSQKPDYRVPSTAFILHKRLGLKEDCICFDINLACSGFIFGLHTICSLLNNSDGRTALLITGDTSHRTLSPFDRTMIMLFGDSGTATLVQKSEAASPIQFALRTDGGKFKSIITPAGAYRNRNSPKTRSVWPDGIERSDYDTHMKGMEVFTFSITDVAKLLDEFAKHLSKTPDDYDCYALHQANIYILKQLSRKLKIPFEKIPIALDRYGNNSCNSVPLVLSDSYGNKENGMVKVMMSGFGAGLSWGCCSATIDSAHIHPIIFTDEYFKG
jgi:3-oxoacyl-[acyl-carrier-protein] synthase-3